MSLKAAFAQITGHVSGAHVGETLSNLANAADQAFDVTINRAHQQRTQARGEIAKIAETELERVEVLLETAKRRALSLRMAGVLDSKARLRLNDVVAKVI